MVTRDTYNFAMKTTAVKVDDQWRETIKDPVTDTGMKKSQRGFVRVNDNLSYTDGLTHEQYQDNSGLTKPLFVNGQMVGTNNTYKEIVERVRSTF